MTPAQPVGASASYLESLQAEFPGLRVVPKASSSLCRAIDVALRAVTLGGQSAFLTRYVTTLGRTIYVPSDWDRRADADRYATLRHEAVHLRQFRRYGWVGMTLLYLLPLLPMGLALGRARLEWEAYAETLRAVTEVRGLGAAAALEDHIVRQFTSAAYGWMWPFPRIVRGWVRAELVRLEAEERGAQVRDRSSADSTGGLA